MPEDIIWIVGERTGDVKVTATKKLPFVHEIEINDKMPKGQLNFAESFNAMRKRLIDLNQMESK